MHLTLTLPVRQIRPASELTEEVQHREAKELGQGHTVLSGRVRIQIQAAWFLGLHSYALAAQRVPPLVTSQVYRCLFSRTVPVLVRLLKEPHK